MASASSASATGFGDLPPPPQTVVTDAAEKLMLELVINGRRSNIVAPVTREGPHFRLALADLKRAGLLVDHPKADLSLDELPGIGTQYDAARQQLILTAAPSYFPNQRLGDKKRAFVPASYDTGALLNYDIYLSGGDGKAQASLYHEARFFSAAGTVSTTGAIRSGHRKPYIRFETVWRRSDETTATTIEVGDFITRGLPWASAVRLGGIQISRDFSVRPDIVTYPLPQFSGTAALPSTVDLLVGGRRVGGGAVAPGPFEVGGLPLITGAGEANIVVTDMHGRSIAAAMPFYVSSDLLQPGLTDFALNFGAFRDNYGISNFDYGGVGASASARHGITPGLTLEIRAEIANGTELAGGGAVIKLGNGGVVSGSYSRSFGRDGDGSQLMLGYNYQSRFFSVSLQHSRQSRDYADLGSLGLSSHWGARRVSSATLSLALGPGGTLGVGYFDIDGADRGDSRLINGSWTLPLWNGSRINANATHDLIDKSWSGAISFAIPLGGRRGNLSAGLIDTADQRRSWRADYARSLPSNGGLGWSASALQTESENLFLRGDISLRTDSLFLRGGAYGSDGITAWAGASGSLIFMDGALFAANRASDAFVVVNTGEPDIPVRYENQLVGRTNRKGQLLLPWASAYYAGKYEIDPLGLPPNVRVSTVSQRIAVARGSGHVLRFPVERMTAARATITDAAGAPIPAGAPARLNDEEPTYIGWDGLLFAEAVAPQNTLAIELPDGTRCIARFTAPRDRMDTVIDLGEIRCLPDAS
ncbi:MAG: fimbrial biogenesis outer membrane usher protein [Sphingopyxis sp.]|nr:fimbrial biogenesis outer membrane usher protein [Sphingopyxis sp.]